MRVVLICCGGISTNVFSYKLNDYIKENNMDDTFLAIKVDILDKYINNVDVIAIAPQALFYYDQIENKAREIGIPIYIIPNAIFSSMDVVAMYQDVYKLNMETVTLKRSYEEEIAVLSGKDLYKAIVISIINKLNMIVTIGGISILLRLLFSKDDFLYDAFNNLYQITLGMISIYYSFCFGYYFAYHKGLKSLQYGLINIVAFFFSMPVKGSSDCNSCYSYSYF